jgi:hypothetical protein
MVIRTTFPKVKTRVHMEARIRKTLLSRDRIDTLTLRCAIAVRFAFANHVNREIEPLRLLSSKPKK